MTKLYNAFIKTEEENQKYDGARVSLDYAESHKLSNAQKILCLAAKIQSRDLTSTLTAMKRKVNLFADFQKEIMQLNHLSDTGHSKDLMREKKERHDAEVYESERVPHCHKRSKCTFKWDEYVNLQNSNMAIMGKEFEKQKQVYVETHAKNYSEMNKILATCSPTMNSALYYGIGEPKLEIFVLQVRGIWLSEINKRNNSHEPHPADMR